MPGLYSNYGICQGGEAGNLCRRAKSSPGSTSNWLHIVSREGAETKTGESHKVPIHPALKPLLVAAVPTRRGRDGWFFCETPSRKYPKGDRCMNTKRLNEDFLKILKQLGISAGKQNGGFTIHSLRSFFKTFCINAGVPKEVVDIWQGHARFRRHGPAFLQKRDGQIAAAGGHDGRGHECGQRACARWVSRYPRPQFCRPE